MEKGGVTDRWAEAFSGNRRQLSNLFANMSDGFTYNKIITDKDGKPIDFVFLEVNSAFEKMTGLSKRRVVGKRVTNVISGAETTDWIGVYGRVALEGDSFVLESFSKQLNKWFSISTYSPRKGFFVALFSDITARKKAEKEIADLAKFPLENPAVVLRVGQNGILMFANPSAYDFLKEWQIKVGEHIPEHFRQLVIDALASGNRIEFEANLGSEIFSFLIAPIISEGYANLYGRKVTKRKKAEEKLKDAKEQYALLFNSVNEGFAHYKAIYDENSRLNDLMVLEINPAGAKYLGVKREDQIGKTLRQVWVDIEDSVFDLYRKVDQTDSSYSLEHFSNLTSRWYSVTIYKVSKDHFAATFNDITERKHLQQRIEEYTKDLEKLVEDRTKKLELSSLYARNLIEASLDPLVTINIAGKITGVNKATEQATGRSREELIGSDFSDNFTESEKAKVAYERAFKDGFVRDYPLAIKHKSGKITEVLYNATVYRDDAGKMQGVFAAARDVTELRKAEKLAEETAKKLKDAERLAAIGATAGMVGHDIRNPLQAIIGDLYLAREELAELAESEERNNALEDLCEIEKNIDYINKIVVDLQDFARPLSPRTEETDLKRVVDQLLAKDSLPQNIKIKRKFDTEKVVADSSFINRIMYNLITNAVQAMPNGGTLTIHAYKESDNTYITIKDTGVGIPEKIKGKLFTPMFTTKSKGQGFGLSVVKRMVEALGGTVTFESQEGKGTTFKVCLPPRQKRL